jgi:hypothetical protein
MIGKVVNNYKLLEKIGEGAFRTVYRVENVHNKEMYFILLK